MPQGKRLLGFYNYTVILTYVGMLTGFIGIIYAFEGNTYAAIKCLMAAGLCDMFDGTIASTMERTEQERCFGIQIDSLSDLVCFGVLPASIVYCLNSHNSPTLFVCLLYLTCAMIRLAYFNVDEQERQKTSSSSREVYYGLPVTSSALLLPIVYGTSTLFSQRPVVASAASLLTMAILFLLPFPLRKPKLIGKICMVMCGLLDVYLLAFACDGV